MPSFPSLRSATATAAPAAGPPSFRVVATSVCLAAAAWALASTGAAHAHGSHGERLQRAERAALATPDDATPWIQQVTLRLDASDPIAAERALRAAIERGAPALATGALRTRIRLALGDAEGALEAADATLRIAPDDPATHRLRSRALARLGRRDEAVTSLDAAIARQHPAIPDLYLERARLLAAGPAPRLDEALAGLDRARAQLGTIVALESVAVEFERERGDPDAALLRLDRLPGAATHTPGWLARRASLLEQAGRRDDARAAWLELQRRLDAMPAARRSAAVYARLEVRARAELDRLGGAQ